MFIDRQGRIEECEGVAACSSGNKVLERCAQICGGYGPHDVKLVHRGAVPQIEQLGVAVQGVAAQLLELFVNIPDVLRRALVSVE